MTFLIRNFVDFLSFDASKLVNMTFEIQGGTSVIDFQSVFAFLESIEKCRTYIKERLYYLIKKFGNNFIRRVRLHS